ncbi:MAG: DUF805 domain-containing protein [Sulfitobacter sp.]
MSTQWYYAVEGASVGPVDQVEFDGLVAAGTIRRETLVWQEGMDDWLPYGRVSMPAMQAPPTAPPPFLNGSTDPARADANSFIGALKDGFSRYVDFKTRSTRSQFWWWVLWSMLINLVSGILDISLGMGELGPINILTSLAMFLPTLALSIRRLHDIGRSGWWYLIVLVPLAGLIVLIVFFCTKTQEETNRWGVPPRR